VGMGHHCAVARLSRRPVVLNVDGLDWQRGKWGPVARGYFYSAAAMAVRSCSALVTDAHAMHDYYREHFGRDSTVIAYGADVENSAHPSLITRFGVQPRQYYLIVSRLIPENTLEAMLDGFRASRTQRKLVVVGAANYRDAFHRRLEQIAASDARVSLVGLVNDQTALKELWCNCYAYLHGHSVGGTNPALLRAMGYGACVLARDTVFNRETLGDAGYYFAAEPAAIATLIDQCDDSPGYADALRTRAQRRVADHYDWETITSQYEQLFRDVVNSKGQTL
jgi:glycosyltransferase involved in cell wall biosynthesis